jgi:DNA uptake protein ComE-like DNA-binding protein
MSIPADHKALVFFGAVAVLGAGVRVTRAASHQSVPAATTAASAGAALDRQMQAADSSAKAGRASTAKRAKPSAARRPSRAKSTPATPGPRPKLDLDIATAAQIDSLPGITPLMARRIVTDRLLHGPFRSVDGLRRVRGTSPKLLRAVDSLITFSGTFAFPDWDDTVIPRRVRRARHPRPP